MEPAVWKTDDGVLTLDDFRCSATERRREARTAVLKRVWVFVPKREPQIGHLVDCSPHGVGLLVTKNSGGPMTAAKLQAAGELGAQVVVVERPPLPPGSTAVATVAEALTWVRSAGQGSGG